MPGFGIPEAQRLVVATGEQALAVGRKGDAPDHALMPGEGADLVPGFGIPEA